MGRVLIAGGYGNFGKRIAGALARHGVPLLIAGRSRERADALAARLQLEFPDVDVRAVALDIGTGLDACLRDHEIAVVANTCGPFQNQDYRVANVCIQRRVHYIDLADGRDFVTGISRLDAAAKAAGVSVISGASSVPGLSSAVVERLKPRFSRIDQLIYGISPGQKTERGLATAAGILSYVGKPLMPSAGDRRTRYGWQDLYRQTYPGLGSRWMGACDIPDLDLLPAAYGIGQAHFSGGFENTLLHFGVWAVSWLVRIGLPLDLPRHAAFLLQVSRWFDRFGSNAGGMHVIAKGLDAEGRPLEQRWFIIARNADGPQIPCVPAILLAKRLATGADMPPGAFPCVGLVTLEDYLAELERFAITTYDG